MCEEEVHGKDFIVLFMCMNPFTHSFLCCYLIMSYCMQRIKQILSKDSSLSTIHRVLDLAMGFYQGRYVGMIGEWVGGVSGCGRMEWVGGRRLRGGRWSRWSSTYQGEVVCFESFLALAGYKGTEKAFRRDVKKAVSL